ncbi:MAG: hypothetical protein J2O38_00855 [Acidimicrobiales bacterium]|nr:hypothetical protein [Acidimicrobiales bacterium]
MARVLGRRLRGGDSQGRSDSGRARQGTARGTRMGRQRGFVGLGVVGAVSALVGLGLVGVGAGSSAARLLDGEAWLADARAGTVSLANGYSGKVMGAVPTGLRGGDPFTVVQRPSGAYVVDERTGALVRIDGARLRSSPPQAEHGFGARAIEVVTGRGRTYLVDRSVGLIQRADPGTLRLEGPPLRLRSPVSQAVTDREGNLWVALPAIGTVVEVDGSRVAGRHPVGQADDAISVGVTSVCVEAVDASSGVATCVSRPSSIVHFKGRGNQIPVVAASPSSRNLLIVEGTQAIEIDSRTGASRTASLPAGARVTQAVVNGNDAYLLNATSQQVDLVSLSHDTLGQSFAPPGGATDLTVGGGVVFANNANGSQALAIARSGTEVPVKKYDPEHPYAGLGPAGSIASGTAAVTTGAVEGAQPAATSNGLQSSPASPHLSTGAAGPAALSLQPAGTHASPPTTTPPPSAPAASAPTTTPPPSTPPSAPAASAPTTTPRPSTPPSAPQTPAKPNGGTTGPGSPGASGGPAPSPSSNAGVMTNTSGIPAALVPSQYVSKEVPAGSGWGCPCGSAGWETPLISSTGQIFLYIPSPAVLSALEQSGHLPAAYYQPSPGEFVAAQPLALTPNTPVYEELVPALVPSQYVSNAVPDGSGWGCPCGSAGWETPLISNTGQAFLYLPTPAVLSALQQVGLSTLYYQPSPGTFVAIAPQALTVNTPVYEALPPILSG